MDRSLELLKGSLFIQCRPSHVAQAAEIASAHGGGLVITGASPLASAEQVRERWGFTGPVLCDADRYSGSRRVSAGRGVTSAWFSRQRDLGLVPLSDSGYVAPRNVLGLRTILRVTAEQPPPAIAVLPVDVRWFKTSAVCDALVREVNRAGVPVALVLEHTGDPFAQQYLVRNFLRLLGTAAVPVLLLRSDVSALGALCHGAHAAAVGSQSALRHLYPIRPGGFHRPVELATFVSPLLSYHGAERIERIVEGTPEYEHLWSCDCPVCEGRAPVPDSPRAAFQHALHALFLLRADLVCARTPQALASTWHEHCSHALWMHEEVRRLVPRHRPPAGLRAWMAVTDDPMSDDRAIPAQPETRTSHRRPVHDLPG